MSAATLTLTIDKDSRTEPSSATRLTFLLRVEVRGRCFLKLFNRSLLGMASYSIVEEFPHSVGKGMQC